LHAKYENYLSYLCVLAIAWYVYFDAFFPSAASGFFPFFLFVFAFPGLGVLLAGSRSVPGRYGRHFLLGVAILHASAFSASYFFRFSGVSVLEISLLSLAFSILLFGSYLSLRKPAR
jgi:hypothetical protein